MGKTLFAVFPAALNIEGFSDGISRAMDGYKSFLQIPKDAYLPGYYEMHLAPLRNDEGKVEGVLQILHDVAHRIKAEDELRRLNRELLAQYAALNSANDELTHFAKIASHDLKEPLRKIYTFSELIMVHEAGKLSNSGRSNFRRIQKSVQRMALLTDDIASFVEIGTTAQPAIEVDLAAVLQDLLTDMRQEIAQAGATVDADPLPPVAGFEKVLKQLLRQLLSNALKFHHADIRPVISVRYSKVPGTAAQHPDAEPGVEYHCISVTDNGIGIDMQYRERIFGLFQRLHPEGTYRGSGMGLAIARKAARMHSGFITVQSAPDEGSTFFIFLPAV